MSFIREYTGIDLSRLSSYVTGWNAPKSDEQRLEQNTRVIAGFPNDKNAQIKGDIRGNLFIAVRSKESVLYFSWQVLGSWASVKLGRYTELRQTVKIMNETCRDMQEIWSRSMEEFGGVDEPSTEDIKSATAMLNQHYQMFKGLENFKGVYDARYEENEKEGLDFLRELHQRVLANLRVHHLWASSLCRRCNALESDDGDLTQAIDELAGRLLYIIGGMPKEKYEEDHE